MNTLHAPCPAPRSARPKIIEFIAFPKTSGLPAELATRAAASRPRNSPIRSPLLLWELVGRSWPVRADDPASRLAQSGPNPTAIAPRNATKPPGGGPVRAGSDLPIPARCVAD